MTGPRQPAGQGRPLVSVLIPSYNRAAMLRRAIKSVLAQTFTDFELIIVDDGSADNTVNVVKEFSDSRVRFMRRSVNEGAARARNIGVEVSCGEWIAFLDSDDEWLPRRLELQMSRLQQNGPPMDATVGYCLLVEHDDLTGRTWQPLESLKEGDVFDQLLMGQRPDTTSAYMVERSALLDVGGFDEAWPSGQDIDLWLRLVQEGHRFAAVNEVLVVRHRHHGPQLSTDPIARLRGFRLFNRRWGKVMRRRLGDEAYRSWLFRRLRRIQQIHWSFVRQEIENGNKTRALGYCLIMLLLLPELVVSRSWLLIDGTRNRSGRKRRVR